MSSLSSVGFFSSGEMNASLNWDGTTPDFIDMLNMQAIYGANKSMFDFNNRVGNGSILEYLFGASITCLITSSILTGVKLSSCSAFEASTNSAGGPPSVAARMSLTFLSKKSATSFAVILVADEVSFSSRHRMLSIVLQRSSPWVGLWVDLMPMITGSSFTVGKIQWNYSSSVIVLMEIN